MRFNKNGFTLIEMMIAITIFFIFVVGTYVNYAYYQNIAQVKMSLKDVSQNLSIARNMSINGIQSGSTNQSVGIYFKKDDNNIKYFLYNYSGATLDISSNPYKKVELKPNVKIANIKAGTTDYDDILVVFDSITGNTKFYNSSIEITDNVLEFDISFKNASNFPLKRNIKYFKNTNITDY